MPPRELVNGKAGASCHGNKLIVAHGARLCTCKRIGATRPGRDAATFDKARFELGISEPGVDYVFDLWAERWRLREATGDMIIVRYADDFIVGFQHEADARHFLDAMRERLREFALSHHPEKTRLIEFGRLAVENRKRRGLGKPETFTFLRFIFICSKTRWG